MPEYEWEVWGESHFLYTANRIRIGYVRYHPKEPVGYRAYGFIPDYVSESMSLEEAKAALIAAYEASKPVASEG